MSGAAVSEAPTEQGLLEEIAALVLELKAQYVVSIDLRGASAFTDFFLIASATSDRQARAICEKVRTGLKERYGLLPARTEGLPEARWALLDYGDVVLHVFSGELREHYRLESLWGELPRRDWSG
ncbi:MAG: ribosome silencing factor [Solirubrobacterales bacterium]